MILLTAWRNHYRLGRPSEFLDTEGWKPMNERMKVRNWLRDARKFPHFMAGLRDMSLRDDRRFKTTFDDLQIADRAADRISMGEWRLLYRAVEPIPMAEVIKDEILGPQVDEAPPPVAHEAPPPPPESPTLEQNADEARLAETVRQAAKDGTPFCEECMKAALRKSSPPPAEEEEEAPAAKDPDPQKQTFLGDADENRIAEAKKEAARLGLPFCEECMRAELAAESAADEESTDSVSNE